MAVRQARFSGPSYDTLVESTVRSTISFVAQTFRENDRSNPTKDEDGELGRLLSRQFRSFRNKDPTPRQQKALPICVLIELSNLSLTETQTCIHQLANGAFFFAMRSCEYLLVTQAEKRRTDIIRLRNIRFFKEGIEMSHNNPNLISADSVSITFEWQKKDERSETVTHLSTDHPLLSPPRLWTTIVKQIRSYPGSNDDTPVSAVWRNNRIEHISSKEMVKALQAAVESIGEDTLGIKKEDIGTHSIQSGAAIAMYLGDCPVFTIMMIGRWSSDAFLRYIRKQVEQFSHNISKHMIKNHSSDTYQMCNEYHDSTQDRITSKLDKTRYNIDGSMSHQAHMSAISLRR